LKYVQMWHHSSSKGKCRLGESSSSSHARLNTSASLFAVIVYFILFSFVDLFSFMSTSLFPPMFYLVYFMFLFALCNDLLGAIEVTPWCAA
jgi:hypothetical protein